MPANRSRMRLQPGGALMSGDIRARAYDRIRESSKDEVILEEMIRLGFWRRDDGQPSVPEELISTRKGELNREIAELYRTAGTLGQS